MKQGIERFQSMNQKKRIRTLPLIQQRAKELRKHMTAAENLLWERLRSRRLNDLKFRRQAPLGPFIADFYCSEHRLVVEVDGDVHESQVEYDQARTEQFESYGYRVIRTSNQEVSENIESVLSRITRACIRSPLPKLGEGQG
jgi:very-short-patch-repair endonuclease